MRKAHDIYKAVVASHDFVTYADAAIEAINIARKEAIEECAKRAKTKWDLGHKEIESAYVDKKSILSLIDELK